MTAVQGKLDADLRAQLLEGCITGVEREVLLRRLQQQGIAHQEAMVRLERTRHQLDQMVKRLRERRPDAEQVRQELVNEGVAPQIADGFLARHERKRGRRSPLAGLSLVALGVLLLVTAAGLFVSGAFWVETAWTPSWMAGTVYDPGLYQELDPQQAQQAAVYRRDQLAWVFAVAGLLSLLLGWVLRRGPAAPRP
jgi:hypothetical protein